MMRSLRRLKAGLSQPRRREAPSSPLPFKVWQSGYVTWPVNEEHWISQAASVQLVRRRHMSDVYVGSMGGVSQVFYSLDDLTEWFIHKGLDNDEPIWGYLDQLAIEELSDLAD